MNLHSTLTANYYYFQMISLKLVKMEPRWQLVHPLKSGLGLKKKPLFRSRGVQMHEERSPKHVTIL